MTESVERGKTVLVVDDEFSVRTLIEVSLEGLGLTILQAVNAEEALQVYRQRLEQQEPDLDLLLTDIRMPNPRQGIEMVQDMVKLGYKGPVIIMSGTMQDLNPVDIETFLTQGLQVVPLQKPFSPLNLVRRATQLLDRAQPSR